LLLQIAQEEARVKMKEAQVELIEDEIRKGKIISPYTGVVIERFVEKGERIEKGKGILKIGQVDPLRIDILVPEEIISQVKRDDQVRIKFDALKDNEEVYGKVSTIIPFSDTSSRTYKVRIHLYNRERRFKVGMMARVSLFYGENEDVLMAPQDGPTLSGENKSIIIVKDQTAHMVPVQTGRRFEGWIEVQGDISEGDLVVIRGNERLQPGQPVEVISHWTP
jgi:RND family efflux transporter MFP subunit